jgi:exodeoxyribonuclease III
MSIKNFYSWNVNGLKAILRKNFNDFIREYNPDILCLQETKSQNAEVQKLLSYFNEYHVFSNSAEKKGYSGTAIMSKTKPADVFYGIDIPEHDNEGRVITLEYANYFLVNVYVPNSGEGLRRLDYRVKWDNDFRTFLKKLSATKPVIATGDFNVAHKEIDIARPKPNYNKSAGYTQKEIDGFSAHLKAGVTDTFRAKYPEKVKYSYWSFRANARARNVGWRIDYFLTGNEIADRIHESCMLNEVHGSDHCPLVLELKE